MVLLEPQGSKQSHSYRQPRLTLLDGACFAFETNKTLFTDRPKKKCLYAIFNAIVELHY